MLNVNVFEKKLVQMVKDDQIMPLDDDFEVFLLDDGSEPVGIITRDTESGEIMWYGVYLAKVVNQSHKAFEYMHNVLDLAKEAASVVEYTGR